MDLRGHLHVLKPVLMRSPGARVKLKIVARTSTLTLIGRERALYEA